MSTRTVTHAPSGGASLMTAFGVPGGLSGFLYWLVGAAPLPGPESVEASLKALIVFGGLTYVLTVTDGNRTRAAIFGVCLGVTASLLLFLGAEGQAASISSGALPWLATLGVVGVVLPFLRASQRGHRFLDYAPLHEDAWTMPAIVALAAIFVGAGLLLAYLVGALFAFIGLGFVRHLMLQGWFTAAYAGLLLAVGAGVVRQREAAVLAVRGILLALIRVSAPIFALCVTLFIGGVMIRGFGGLVEGWSPVAILVTASTVCIIMLNALVGEESQRGSVLFAATARLLGVLLPFLVALAFYGLSMRITAEGWTPPRIRAALFFFLAAIYAVPYALAALTERWAILRYSNIVLSGVLLVTAVSIMTPFFRPLDWSAASQVQELEAEAGEATAADLLYLRDRLGEPGRAAFGAIKAGSGPLAKMAAAAEAGRELSMQEEGAIALLKNQGVLTVRPEGAKVPDKVRRAFGFVLNSSAEAVLILDAEDGAAWLVSNSGYRVSFHRLAERAEQQEQVAIYPSRGEGEAIMAAVKKNGLSFRNETFRLPVAGDMLIVPDLQMLQEQVEEEGLGEPEDLPN
jgi:hypothetical protein